MTFYKFRLLFEALVAMFLGALFLHTSLYEPLQSSTAPWGTEAQKLLTALGVPLGLQLSTLLSGVLGIFFAVAFFRLIDQFKHTLWDFSPTDEKYRVQRFVYYYMVLTLCMVQFADMGLARALWVGFPSTWVLLWAQGYWLRITHGRDADEVLGIDP